MTHPIPSPDDPSPVDAEPGDAEPGGAKPEAARPAKGRESAPTKATDLTSPRSQLPVSSLSEENSTKETRAKRTTKKPASKKKATAKKPTPKKGSSKKSTAKKTIEKPASETPAGEGSPAKKQPAKKQTAKKKTAKKKTAKKQPAKKPVTEKQTAKQPPLRKKALISKGKAATLVPYEPPKSKQKEKQGTSEKKRAKNAEGGVLTWHAAPSVPQAIRASFGEAIDFAKLMAERSEEHPALSVHEFRKTTRRLRALVKLLRGMISRDAARSIDTGLRSAVLPTSGLRDARILLSTLERLPKIPKSKDLRKSLAERFESRIAEIESRGDEVHVLSECCTPFARLPGELADALPAVVAKEELCLSIRRSYRRARRSCRSAIRVPEDAAIHRARKRVKELRYQLEWLLEISDKRVKKRQKRVAALAQDLGEVTDLLVLEEAVLDDRDSLVGQGSSRFCRKLRTIILARFDEVAIGLEELFAESASDFTEGVARKLP